MLALARAGAAEGLWLRADRQTAGRGREGREWTGQDGNLFASTLVRLRPTDPPPATLALLAAVALAEAVLAHPGRSGVVVPTLKWPNDLLIGGAKLSGILLERAGDGVVIGFGVNLCRHPVLGDRVATSLAAYGVDVAPVDFVETLAVSVARWLARWRREGLAPVRARWQALAHPVGTALTVRIAGAPPQDGLFDGLNADGALLLRLASGERRVIHAGDVFLL